MDPMTASQGAHGGAPFNGAIEIGLRALVLLTESFPVACSLQRLVVYDYLVVHSDDVPGGPPGLHPKTPHRGAELLVRRAVLEKGLLLYQSRGLIERQYTQGGVMLAATERSASFLDVLNSPYLQLLRQRAVWVMSAFGERSDASVSTIAREHIGEWGAEFEMESVLRLEQP